MRKSQKMKSNFVYAPIFLHVIFVFTLLQRECFVHLAAGEKENKNIIFQEFWLIKKVSSCEKPK